MLNFLEKLPNIYIVFFAFVFLLTAFFIKDDREIFNLMNTALGAVIGLAMKSGKPAQQTIDSVNIEQIKTNDFSEHGDK